MMKTRRIFPVVIILLVAVISGCQRRYPINIVNLADVAVTIEMSQFHSKGFDGTRPLHFTDDLLIDTRHVSLRPGEKKEVTVTDAAGGFWIRWRQVEPVQPDSAVSTLDLIRDQLEITIE